MEPTSRKGGLREKVILFPFPLQRFTADCTPNRLLQKDNRLSLTSADISKTYVNTPDFYRNSQIFFETKIIAKSNSLINNIGVFAGLGHIRLASK